MAEQRVVEKVLELNASVERVWRAITDPPRRLVWSWASPTCTIPGTTEG